MSLTPRERLAISMLEHQLAIEDPELARCFALFALTGSRPGAPASVSATAPAAPVRVRTRSAAVAAPPVLPAGRPGSLRIRVHRALAPVAAAIAMSLLVAMILTVGWSGT